MSIISSLKNEVLAAPKKPGGGILGPNYFEEALPAQTYTPATYTPTTSAAVAPTITAPQIVLPDYSKIPGLPDYTGRIEQAGQTAIESGLRNLRELVFKPEYEQERGRVASRGLVGSGVENDVLKTLLTGQEARAGEFATGIQAQTFKEITSELQSLRSLQYDQNKTILSQQFEAAMKKGDLESAANIANAELKLDYEDLSLKNKDLELNIAKFNDDSNWRAFTSGLEQQKIDLEKDRLALEKIGVNVDLKLNELEERRLIVNTIAGAGFTGQQYVDAVNSALINAGYDPITPEKGKTKITNTPSNEPNTTNAGSTGGSVTMVNQGPGTGPGSVTPVTTGY